MKFTIRHHKVILLITIENKHCGRVGTAPGRRLAKHAAICLLDHAIDEIRGGSVSELIFESKKDICDC